MTPSQFRSLLREDAATLRAAGGSTLPAMAKRVEQLLAEHEDAVLIARAITTQRFLVIECVGDDDDGKVSFVPFIDPSHACLDSYLEAQMESAERLSVRDDGFILLTESARERLRKELEA